MTDLLPRVAVLADGTRVEVRSLRPEDRDELARGFARLSPASRHARFLGGKRELDEEELRFLTEVDGRDHVAIVAVRGSDDLKSDIGLGVARFIRLPPGDVAEAALTVADAAQNKGLGRVLLEVLASLAKEQGIRAFRAEVLADNARMRRLLEGAGGVVIEDHGSTVVTEVTLDPVPGSGQEHREHPLRRILRAAAEAIDTLRPPE